MEAEMETGKIMRLRLRTNDIPKDEIIDYMRNQTRLDWKLYRLIRRNRTRQSCSQVQEHNGKYTYNFYAKAARGSSNELSYEHQRKWNQSQNIMSGY